MPYTLSFSLALGSSQTGLTLKAQLVDTAGADVGSEITTGFVEAGAGNYLFTSSAIPAGHRGGVKFYTGTLPTGLKAFAAINPEETEAADALLDHAAGVETGRTLRQALRIILAALAGKASIVGSTITFRDTNDSVNRIVALTDEDGQRLTVTLDAS